MRCRNFIKAVILIMSITLPLFGCGDVDSKKEAIESALNAKYGEEFILDRIGGDLSEYPRDTNKGYAYSIKYPTRLFPVQIKKDSNVVIDNYLDVLMSLKQETEIQKLLGDVNVQVICRIASYWYPPENAVINMNPKDYLLLDDDIDCMVFFIALNTIDKRGVHEKITGVLGENKNALNEKLMYKILFIDEMNIDNLIKDTSSYISLADFYRENSKKYAEYEIMDINTLK